MRVETTAYPRLNCVRMSQSDSIVLVNALMAARRQLLAEGVETTVKKKCPLKSFSTLRKR